MKIPTKWLVWLATVSCKHVLWINPALYEFEQKHDCHQISWHLICYKNSWTFAWFLGQQGVLRKTEVKEN